MAHPDTATLATLYQRLRRPPRAHSVAGSLPVLFFGDLFSAQITTVGINPSDQEYLDGQGSELDGAARRFETLSSLHASSRQTLTNAQCAQAIATMRSYFARSSTVYRWFRSLERVLVGMGYTYSKGQIAHLDLVQEATTPTWSALQRSHRSEADNLFADDLPFLQWQIAKFPLRAVICNGMTVFRSVCGLLDQSVEIANSSLARVTWYATRGQMSGRTITVVGWNIPLARPTGLGKVGEGTLGHTLAAYIEPPQQ
ncbi:MAG TPA: hypothetical protein VFW17_10105 [Ktedonobacterales bacterium]|nr:hypothetical protein [Ktedonobacterales bacterium]